MKRASKRAVIAMLALMLYFQALTPRTNRAAGFGIEHTSAAHHAVRLTDTPGANVLNSLIPILDSIWLINNSSNRYNIELLTLGALVSAEDFLFAEESWQRFLSLEITQSQVIAFGTSLLVPMPLLFEQGLFIQEVNTR